MKKIIALLLALLMCLGLFAGCGGNNSAKTDSEAPAPAKDAQVSAEGRKTKLSAVVINMDSLHPYNIRGAITANFLVFEPLWTADENKNTVGVIAKDWTINDKVIDVEIYDYIYDSQGNHLTASDVVFSIQTSLDSGMNNNKKYFESVEQTGEYSVRITLNVVPWSSFLYQNMTICMVTEAAYSNPDNDFVGYPIGTGHYTVKEFVAANKAVYEKREHHWQSDVNEDLVPYSYKANADVVELDCILETPQIQNGLETGVLQAGAVNATIAEALEANPDLKVTANPGKYMHGIMLNCYQGILADNIDLRKAVLYAIDTAAIAQAVTKGTGHMAYTIGNESLAGYPKQLEEMDYYHYDLDKAKEYMAKAGYPDGGITLKWLGKTEEAVQLTATIIQAQLAEIGIALEISNLDNTTYMAQRPAYEGDWNLCWGDSVPKGQFVMAFQSYVDNRQYAQGNMEGLNDPEMQEAFETALYNPTEENLLALHNIVKESASLVGNYVDFDFWGHDANVTIVVGADGEISAGACVLGPDYNVFAD